MGMSLKHINILLRQNGVSSIASPLNMPEKQQKLLIRLGYGRKQFLLELRQDGENRSWKISEEEVSMCSVIAPS